MPLPNSSIITKLLVVQCSNIVFVSSSSIKNVDFPSNILSDAPNLQNILSKGANLNYFAGTAHPIYANMIETPSNLNKVDLPLILGPVNRSVSTGFIKLIVFGTQLISLFYNKQGWYAS